jgi:hypothetical protein
MLETRDPTPEDEERRATMIEHIQMLSQRLEAADPLTATASM